MTAPTVCTCGHAPAPRNAETYTAGYGVTDDGSTICYECCGKRDLAAMIRDGRATLYLSRENGSRTGYVGNWPGTLRFPVGNIRTGHHNIARVRYDFRFTCDGKEWAGVQYGDNTQIAHCRRLVRP